MDEASYASLDFVDLPFFVDLIRMATAYAQFTKNRYHAVKAAHPDKAFTEIAPLIAAEWRSLSQAQKNSYKNKIVRKTRKASPPKSSSAAASAPEYDDDDLLAPVGFNRVSAVANNNKNNKTKTAKTKRKPNKYAEFMRNEGARIRRNSPEMSQVDVVREVGKRWKSQKGSA
jgi:hypothetical protein